MNIHNNVENTQLHNRFKLSISHTSVNVNNNNLKKTCSDQFNEKREKRWQKNKLIFTLF